MSLIKLELVAVFEGDEDRLAEIAEALRESDSLIAQKSLRMDGKTWIVETDEDPELIHVKHFDGGKAGWGIQVNFCCPDVEKSEYYRFHIASVLKSGFNAKDVYLTRDGVSMVYACELYPRLNEIENRLRNYLVRFFLPLIGDEWLSETATPDVHNKIKSRMMQTHRKWYQLVNLDLSYMDFRELGELITKKSTGNTDVSELMIQVLDLKSMDDVQDLKKQIESNYSKYFKETFQEHRFHRMWSELTNLRHKVAHNGFLKQENVTSLNKLEDAFNKMMIDAELKLKTLKEFNYAIVTEAPIESQLAEESIPEANDYADLLPKLKILGKIELPKKTHPYSDRRVVDDDDPFVEEFEIEKDEYIEALEDYLAQCAQANKRFLSYDTFRYGLREEGYSWESVTRMTTVLYRLGKVELYQYQDDFSYRSTTAVRMKTDD